MPEQEVSRVTPMQQSPLHSAIETAGKDALTQPHSDAPPSNAKPVLRIAELQPQRALQKSSE
jgi:hypothetical protein